MPRFPKKEAEIIAMAEQMIAGLWANPAVFPNPPHPAMASITSIRRKVRQYNNRREDLIAARAVAEQTTAEKDDALEDLIEAMKADIRYAENTVDFDDDKLKLIGWAGKKTPTALQSPGQSRLLEAPKQGAGWVFLDWKQPADGGKPNAYKVQRRNRPSGPWENVATAILSEITLVDQPERTELEYRVIAVNKSGEGQASNTVMVVL
ncbi:MAG TPA: fibronectin type III domain-containing protein [Phycisphaerales bacterium]|nr:fibronectin type III domain-containing protein [Phycisphaerales bacterium]